MADATSGDCDNGRLVAAFELIAGDFVDCCCNEMDCGSSCVGSIVGLSSNSSTTWYDECVGAMGGIGADAWPTLFCCAAAADGSIALTIVCGDCTVSINDCDGDVDASNGVSIDVIA